MLLVHGHTGKDRRVNDANIGSRSAIPLWTPVCLGLRAKELACP